MFIQSGWNWRSMFTNSSVMRWGKNTGTRNVELKATQTDAGDEIDAYARLLGDAMEGDHTLFVRSDMVDVQWAVVEPILDNATPVYPYAPGSWGPAEADRLVADLGGWVNLK